MSSARINTAKIWQTLTPNNTTILDDFRALYIVSDGNVVVDDFRNNEETFPVTAGQVLPIQPKRLKTTSTATVIGLN